MSFINSLIVGLLSNAFYDGAKHYAKRVFNNREIDFELRRTVSQLEERQANIEGLINRLTNDQSYMLSIIVSFLQQNNLRSQAFLENNCIVLLLNKEDERSINLLTTSKNDIRYDEPKGIQEIDDRFAKYHDYVQRMRGEG